MIGPASGEPSREDTYRMFFTELAEMVFIVGEIPASARFYRDVVGLIPQTEADEIWAGNPGQHQRIALHKGSLFEEYSPRPSGERWSPTHYAFHVLRADLGDAVGHVRSHVLEP